MKTKFELAKNLKKIPDIVQKMDDSDVRVYLKEFGEKMGCGRDAVQFRKNSLVSHLQNTHARVYA